MSDEDLSGVTAFVYGPGDLGGRPGTRADLDAYFPDATPTERDAAWADIQASGHEFTVHDPAPPVRTASDPLEEFFASGFTQTQLDALADHAGFYLRSGDVPGLRLVADAIDRARDWPNREPAGPADEAGP